MLSPKRLEPEDGSNGSALWPCRCNDSTTRMAQRGRRIFRRTESARLAGQSQLSLRRGSSSRKSNELAGARSSQREQRRFIMWDVFRGTALMREGQHHRGIRRFCQSESTVFTMHVAEDFNFVRGSASSAQVGPAGNFNFSC